MDDDGLNMRNWGYYEPSFKEHLGLQLMSPIIDHRDTKPFLSSRENPTIMNPNMNPYYRQSMASEPPNQLHYLRDSWIQRERLLHMLPTNQSFSVTPNTSTSQSIHIPPPPDSKQDLGINLEDLTDTVDVGSLKKRSVGPTRTPKQPKKPKKEPKENNNQSGQRSKCIKRNMEVVINGIDMDISGIPIPVCSCTGVPQQCYRWGLGGWQSACCTTTISMYPLPMSTKRRGARIAGRKMSQGAFKKVLERLGSENYNFGNAIDLRAHWAKHGTNKFVTIR